MEFDPVKLRECIDMTIEDDASISISVVCQDPSVRFITKST